MKAFVMLLVPSLAFAQGAVKAERASANWCLQSSTISAGNVLVTPWDKGSANIVTGTVAPGGGLWVQVTSTSAAGLIYQPIVAGSTDHFIASADMVKPTGSGYAEIAIDCGGTATTCACRRSDGGTCTAEKFGNYCGAYVADLAQAPMRVSVITNCGTGTTSPTLVLYPGQRAVATGTTWFSRVQLEAAKAEMGPSSFIPTAASVRRRLPSPTPGKGI